MISVIVPAYNEEKNIRPLYEKIAEVFGGLKERYVYEIVFVDDGSSDGTMEEIKRLASQDDSLRYIDFSRNFGKEMATTAGINHCNGEACIIIDADLQHPAELIPDFIKKWEEGAEVVVGVRKRSKSDSYIKILGSNFFYMFLNMISETKITPNSTDFRLLDKKVIDEFNRFTEARRMTRALVDWLGFRRAYIYFDANDRLSGSAKYSHWKLFRLALDSFVSLSLLPLKIAGYAGIAITLLSGFSGLYILVGKYFLGWRFASTFSDAENLAIFIVFLVGIILMSLGLISLYIANIYGEVIGRPIYVIREKKI